MGDPFFLRRLRARFHALFRRDGVADEIREELEFHLRMRTTEYERAGQSPAEAARHARQRVGNLTVLQDRGYDVRGGGFMETVIQDLRYAVRTSRRSPALALVVIVSLTLGIGANTAIFSLIRAVMLRSVPVSRPEQIRLFGWYGEKNLNLHQSGNGGLSETASKVPLADLQRGSRSLAYPFFLDLERRTDVFESIFAFAPLGSGHENTTVVVDNSADRVDGEMVSGTYFSALGVHAIAGRLLTVDDERAGAQTAVISYAYWKRRFGGDPGVVGRPISINGLPCSVVGVTSPPFFGLDPGRSPDVWVPMLNTPALAPWGFWPKNRAAPMDDPTYWWLQIGARLKPGLTDQQAAATLDPMFQQFVFRVLPDTDRAAPPHVGLESGARGVDWLGQLYRDPLLLLMALVAVVLLIACANVAVLLLARAMNRRGEFALRLSLGAARGRLVRQVLTESLLLSSIGGVLGILSARWAANALLLLIPARQRPLIDTALDVATLAFAAAISIGAAILFGLAPALLATRVDLLPAIKQSGSGPVVTDGRGHRVWSTGFVVIQIALTVVLLSGSALLVRTLTKLERQSLGIDVQHLLVFDVDASQSGYSGERIATLYEDIVRRLAALPGVESASAMRLRLFSGAISDYTIRPEGVRPTAGSMDLEYNAVGPGFAKTTGLRLLAGRDLTWADVAGQRHVALVNEAMARYFYGELNVVGRRYAGTRQSGADYEIVGVVSNARYRAVREEFPRTAYIPFTATDGPLAGLTFEVKSALDPVPLAAAVRGVVHDVAPTLPVLRLDTMTQQVAMSLWQEHLLARLTSALTALALALAVIGLYGTISYGVGRRRGEIAIRMALGARSSQVLWMILRQALVFAASGIAAGIGLSLWTGQFVASLLYGLTPRDPATLTLTAALLTLVALAAGYVPARRAALLDPAQSLKQE